MSTIGIVLQPRGDRIAFRFDTSIKCGRESYEAVGRKVVPFDGRYRVRFAGRVSRELATGTLRMRARIYTPKASGC